MQSSGSVQWIESCRLSRSTIVGNWYLHQSRKERRKEKSLDLVGYMVSKKVTFTKRASLQKDILNVGGKTTTKHMHPWQSIPRSGHLLHWLREVGAGGRWKFTKWTLLQLFSTVH